MYPTCAQGSTSFVNREVPEQKVSLRGWMTWGGGVDLGVDLGGDLGQLLKLVYFSKYIYTFSLSLVFGFLLFDFFPFFDSCGYYLCYAISCYFL